MNIKESNMAKRKRTMTEGSMQRQATKIFDVYIEGLSWKKREEAIRKGLLEDANPMTKTVGYLLRVRKEELRQARCKEVSDIIGEAIKLSETGFKKVRRRFKHTFPDKATATFLVTNQTKANRFPNPDYGKKNPYAYRPDERFLDVRIRIPALVISAWEHMGDTFETLEEAGRHIDAGCESAYEEGAMSIIRKLPQYTAHK